mmetsp:Transcript_112961/g.326335  ORF Transcript_112961/g.326335 Transcript_112961/m.326335 type:complete len:208 (+) Transcript_112961:552-1175(+)
MWHKVQTLSEARGLQQCLLDIASIQGSQPAENTIQRDVVRAQHIVQRGAQVGLLHLGEALSGVLVLAACQVEEAIRSGNLGLTGLHRLVLVLVWRMLRLAGEALNAPILLQQGVQPDDRHTSGEDGLVVWAVLTALRNVLQSAGVIALLDTQVRKLGMAISYAILALGRPCHKQVLLVEVLEDARLLLRRLNPHRVEVRRWRIPALH